MNNKKTILLIDDDPDVLSSLRNTIESSRYQVVTAMSGKEGLNKFNTEKPVLVICDIMMEEISSGIDVVKQMREKDENVIIYILSDIGVLVGNNLDIYKLGANGMFQKPINPDKLLTIIKHAV